jgi:hypothetical protein
LGLQQNVQILCRAPHWPRDWAQGSCAGRIADRRPRRLGKTKCSGPWALLSSGSTHSGMEIQIVQVVQHAVHRQARRFYLRTISVLHAVQSSDCCVGIVFVHAATSGQRKEHP